MVSFEFTKSYGLYPSHNALQVPTLLGVVASVPPPGGAGGKLPYERGVNFGFWSHLRYSG